MDTEDIIVVGDDGKKHSGEKCKPHIVGGDTYEGTKIMDNGDKMQDNAQNPVGCNTLTVGSFLVCKYGGIIAPINSGQGREVGESEFVEGKEAYERVMGFQCNEEVDVEAGCGDLMHAMITEEEIQELPVHGSELEDIDNSTLEEIGVEEIDIGTVSSEKSKYYENIKQLIAQITEIDPNEMFSYDIWNFKKIYEQNKEIYERISRETGVPSVLIAALHYRESGCDFDTYLHNGQPLEKKTTIVPRNVLYYDFEEAAVDALNSQQEETEICLTVDSDIVMMMTFAEVYNGTGYTDYRDIASPYVFSGTNVYEKGKYTSDGNFDSEVVDKQPVVYILVMAVMGEE